MKTLFRLSTEGKPLKRQGCNLSLFLLYRNFIIMISLFMILGEQKFEHFHSIVFYGNTASYKIQFDIKI